MNLFGKKQTVQAIAEVLEDGWAIANQELKKPKYNEYRGAEPMLEIGVRIQVKYEASSHGHVMLDDKNQTLLERNPQLVKKV